MPEVLDDIQEPQTGDPESKIPPFMRKKAPPVSTAGIPPFLHSKVNAAPISNSADLVHQMAVVEPAQQYDKAIQGAIQRMQQEATQLEPAMRSILTNTEHEKRASEIQTQVQKGGEMANIHPQSYEQIKKLLPKPLPVEISDDAVNQMKHQTATDLNTFGEVLREHARLNPTKANQMKADMYLLNTQGRAQGKESKILTNAKEMETGKLDYSLQHGGPPQKPEGLFQSIVTGHHERNNELNDYEFFQTHNNDEIRHKLDIERLMHDPDEPIPVGQGVSGEMGRMVGSNAMIMAKGGATALLSTMAGAPEAAPYMAAAISSPEFVARGFAGSLKQNYYQLIDQGVNPDEAIKTAKNQATIDAAKAGAQGALMTMAGAKLGGRPGTGFQFTPSFKNIITGIAKQTKEFGKESLQSGLPNAAITGGLELGSNVAAKSQGIKRNIMDNVFEAAGGQLAFELALGAVTKLAAKPAKIILNGIAKQPEAAIQTTLQDMENHGTITPEQHQEIGDKVAATRALDSQIPPHIEDEDTRIKIADLIQHRTKLEGDLETINKAYHPEIKNKITSIDEEIQKLSDLPVKKKTVNEEPKPAPTEGQKKLTEMPQDIISPKPEEHGEETNQADAETKVLGNQGAATQEPALILEKAKSLIQEGIDSKRIADVYKDYIPHADKFLDFINDQIKGGNEDNMRDEFGNKLVDLAKENPNISYAGIKNIKPKENAVSIGQPAQVGAHPIGSEGTGGQSEGSGMGQRLKGTESPGESQTKSENTSEEEISPELDPYGLPFENEVSDKRTGIKNAISKPIRYERQLPPVEMPKMGSDADVLQEGKDFVDSGKIDPRETVNKVLNEQPISTDEVKAMQYYMHQLDSHETSLRGSMAAAESPVEEAHLNSQLQQLSDEIDRATEANIRRGRSWSNEGNIRQIVADKSYNPSRDKSVIKEAYGGKIPEEAQKRIDAIIRERDHALQEVSKLKSDADKIKAVENVEKLKTEKKGKKTSEDFKKERIVIKQSISEKLKKARSGESGLTAVPLPFAKELTAIAPDVFKLVKSYVEEGIGKLEEVVDKIYNELKGDIAGISKRDVINLLAGKYNEVKDTKGELQRKVSDIRAEARLLSKLAEVRKMEENSPKKATEKNSRLTELNRKIAEVRKRNKATWEPSEEQSKENTPLETEINRLNKKADNLEEKIKKGDFAVPEKKTSFFSKKTTELVGAQQRVANAEFKMRQEKRKAFESEKNMYQKGLMWLARGVRLSVLSGYNVLGKLASAATIGGAIKRIPEQTIGVIYSGMFKGISERAPIEGMPSLQAELKFYKEFFDPKKFAKNSWEILKTGSSNLTKRLGGGEHDHVPILYLPTDLHQIIKDPLKRATFESSFKNAMAWSERNGLDINDPLIVQSAENAAFKRANYEIFQESNRLTRWFGEWKSKMEKSGNIGATGKFLADFMIPVSTVPTNIVRRLTTTSPLGLIRGTKQVIDTYRKGIESLNPEQADAVMKQLKQGSLGTALWLAGWFGYSHFGGLYSKYDPNKKRMEGELVSDEMEIDGHRIPKPVQHALPLEIMQLAATARRIHDNYKDRKGESEFTSDYNAALGSIGALLEQIPVVETGVHMAMATKDPYEGGKLKEDIKRRFEPQILKETGVIKKDEKKPTTRSLERK